LGWWRGGGEEADTRNRNNEEGRDVVGRRQRRGKRWQIVGAIGVRRGGGSRGEIYHEEKRMYFI
jgi:hypothetical protein